MSQSVVHCPICGKESDSKFCPNCGIDLDAFRDDNLSPETENFSCEERIESGLCPDCGVENNECSCLETGFENESFNTENNTQGTDFTYSDLDNDTSEESLEEYAEKLHKSNIRRNLIIILSVCVFIVAAIVIYVCFIDDFGYLHFGNDKNSLIISDESDYDIGDIVFSVPENCTYLGVPNNWEYGEALSFVFGEENKSGSLEIREFGSDYEDLKSYFCEDYEVEKEFSLLNNEAILFTISDNSSEYKIGMLFSSDSTAYTINLSSFTNTEIDDDFKESAQSTLNYVIKSIDKLN